LAALEKELANKLASMANRVSRIPGTFLAEYLAEMSRSKPFIMLACPLGPAAISSAFQAQTLNAS
jgi:hypothetical protein